MLILSYIPNKYINIFTFKINRYFIFKISNGIADGYALIYIYIYTYV